MQDDNSHPAVNWHHIPLVSGRFIGQEKPRGDPLVFYRLSVLAHKNKMAAIQQDSSF